MGETLGVIEDRIKYLIDDDLFIVGYANLKNVLEGPYSKFRYGMVIGKKLDDKIIDAISNGPTPEYHRHYQDTNSELSGLAFQIKSELVSENIPTEVVEPTLIEDRRNEQYFKTLSVGFSHKMVATRAGLGWIGKTALFISFRFGPRLRMVSLLTNTPVDFCKTPVNESRCGECSLCVDQCPANAATGQSWNIKLQRSDILDAFRCRKKCKEFSFSAGSPLCGICVSVCPIGKNKKSG
jgi:epoxyqueuosine reductase QueG